MNCRKATKLLAENDAPDSAGEDLALHLSRCSGCRELSGLVAALRLAGAEAARGRDISEDSVRATRDRVRRMLEVRVPAGFSGKRLLFIRAGLAAAAALLLAGGYIWRASVKAPVNLRDEWAVAAKLELQIRHLRADIVRGARECGKRNAGFGSGSELGFRLKALQGRIERCGARLEKDLTGAGGAESSNPEMTYMRSVAETRKATSTMSKDGLL